MSYDAVSAYTVLFGDGEGPAQVSVHGTAEDAWRALDELLHPVPRARRSPRAGRPGGPGGQSRGVDPAAVREAAERWRSADPAHRYWQVAPHRLQVTVPAIARS